MTKFYILDSEEELLKDKIDFEYKTISIANAKELKCDVLYIDNFATYRELFNIQSNVIETESIDIALTNNFELFKLICNNYNKIFDTKIDHYTDRTNGAWNEKLFKYLRIGYTKFAKEVIGFKNYYYIKDENGAHTTIDGFKVSKTYNYRLGDQHYEKDVNISKRYSIDNSNKIKVPDDFRVAYFDIETNASVDTQNVPGEILSIVVQDSMSEEIKKWVVPQGKDLILREKEMIEDFFRYISKFDVITGWNVVKFDIPYVINRAIKLGANTSLMSLTRHKPTCKFNKANALHPYFISIMGLNVVDMMQASVRALAYLDEKLKDGKLDTVAFRVLGDTKIHTDTPAMLWKENRIKELMEYNVQDVMLLMRIDKKLGIVDLLVNTLKIIPGLNLEEASYNSKIIDFYLLSKFDIVLPTINRDRITDITGAIVYEPSAGIHKNVAVLDIAGMYPNLIRTFNISPDTKIYKDEKDCINIDGIRFTTKKEGLLVLLIKDFQELRNKYKKLKKDNENHKDYEIYKLREYATKKILSSVFGVFGFIGFRLFDNDIGNAITASGRSLLGYMKQYVEDRDFIVVAGDTDSIFIKNKDPNYDTNKIYKLNDEMMASFDKLVGKFTTSEYFKKNHMLETEYETLFSKIIIPSAKKKYIGTATMIKGKESEIPKLYYKGSELNKKDVPAGIKEILRNVVMDVLNSESNNYIEIIKNTLGDVVGRIEDLDMTKVLIYKEITREFDAYKVKPQQVRGAQASNKYLGTNFSRQNYKGGVLYVKKNKYDVDTLFISPDITKEKINKCGFKIDYNKYYEKYIVHKIELIFGKHIKYEVFRKNGNLSKWL